MCVWVCVCVCPKRQTLGGPSPYSDIPWRHDTYALSPVLRAAKIPFPLEGMLVSDVQPQTKDLNHSNLVRGKMQEILPIHTPPGLAEGHPESFGASGSGRKKVRSYNLCWSSENSIHINLWLPLGALGMATLSMGSLKLEP